MNPDHLKFIIENLLENSVQALDSVSDPEIRVYADVLDNKLPLDVIDNGGGIATKNQSRIFNAFFSTKRAQGAGLGLAFVRRLVEIYAGKISLSVKYRDKRNSSFYYRCWTP
jgi:signal transduction histidine kinase